MTAFMRLSFQHVKMIDLAKEVGRAGSDGIEGCVERMERIRNPTVRRRWNFHGVGGPGWECGGPVALN